MYPGGGRCGRASKRGSRGVYVGLRLNVLDVLTRLDGYYLLAQTFHHFRPVRRDKRVLDRSKWLVDHVIFAGPHEIRHFSHGTYHSL